MSPGDDGGSFEEVEGHLNDRTILGCLEEGSLDPGVERPLSGAHPDLIIHAATLDPLKRPFAGESEVPATHEGELMVGIGLGARDLFWVHSFEEVSRLLPDLVEVVLKDLLFELLTDLGGNGLDGGIGAIDLVEFSRPDAEEGASFEDLDLDAHLEHISRRSHDDVGHLGPGEHLFDGR